MLGQPDPAPVRAVARDGLARDQVVPHQVTPRRERLPALVLAAELTPERDERGRKARPAVEPARPADGRAADHGLEAQRAHAVALAVDGRARHVADRLAEVPHDEHQLGALVGCAVHPAEDLAPGGRQTALRLREPGPERIELGPKCLLQCVHRSHHVTIRMKSPGASGRLALRSEDALGRCSIRGLTPSARRAAACSRPCSRRRRGR